MEKRTFLGFDVTPRKKLWNRICELEYQSGIYLTERNKADADIVAANQANLAFTQNADKLQKKVLELEGKLQKFHRVRGKSGKYIKTDERSAG